VHTHACRMHWAYDAAIALRYRSGCRTLCSLGLFSNISWVTMLFTILVGGTIVLLRSFSPRAGSRSSREKRITHGAFVPVQLERLLADPQPRRIPHRQPRDVDVLWLAAGGGVSAASCVSSAAI